MKYSVVIPLYNAEKTIERCIRSIFSQTRFDLIDEIIVVDDGSSDHSSEIVEDLVKLSDKIKKVHQENAGAAAARNRGIALARNNWIALMDADDEWFTEKMEKQDDYLERHPEVRALGANRQGERIQWGKLVETGVFQITVFHYCLKCWPCTPSMVFDRSCFPKGNWFSEEMTHAEEGFFFLQLAHSPGLFYLEDSLVLCGGGKRAFGSIGLSGDVRKMHQGVQVMFKKAKKQHLISSPQYVFFMGVEELKYWRRKLLIRLEKK